MRKILAVLIILLVVSIYVLSLKKDTTSKDNQQQIIETSQENAQKIETQQIIEELIELEEAISDNYPATPREVVEYHNKIMAYQYNKSTDEDVLKLAASVIRQLYSVELCNLNNEQKQVEAMIYENISNRQRNEFLEKSQIYTIEFVDQGITHIEVKHFMSLTEIERTYYLIQEDEKWKIHRWEDRWIPEE